MKTIWKYTLDPNAPRVGVGVALPRGASLLCARRQHNDIVVWAMVDPEQETELWQFWVVETGGNCDLPLYAFHLGTVLFYDDDFVLHVFAIPPTPPIIVPLPPGATEAEIEAAKEALRREFGGQSM